MHRIESSIVKSVNIYIIGSLYLFESVQFGIVLRFPVSLVCKLKTEINDIIDSLYLFQSLIGEHSYEPRIRERLSLDRSIGQAREIVLDLRIAEW
jgi:hypothetical protein